MINWVWFALYFVAAEGLYWFWPNRVGNGYSARWLKRWVEFPYFRFVMRYVLWVGIAIIVATGNAIFWGVAVSFVLDDYFFGKDNNWRRKWDFVKNHIKWLMELPTIQPETDS